VLQNDLVEIGDILNKNSKEVTRKKVFSIDRKTVVSDFLKE